MERKERKFSLYRASNRHRQVFPILRLCYCFKPFSSFAFSLFAHIQISRILKTLCILHIWKFSFPCWPLLLLLFSTSYSLPCVFVAVVVAFLCFFSSFSLVFCLYIAWAEVLQSYSKTWNMKIWSSRRDEPSGIVAKYTKTYQNNDAHKHVFEFQISVNFLAIRERETSCVRRFSQKLTSGESAKELVGLQEKIRRQKIQIHATATATAPIRIIT